MTLIGRLLRIALFVTVSWLALAALWLGLPSPSREYSSQPGRYALNTFRSGRSLTRVYDTQAYHHDGYPVQFTDRESRQAFSLSYMLQQKRNTTLLTLTDGLTIDLSPEYITSYPFVSQDKYTIAITGDQDGINPPWFTKADSTLLFWWIHRNSAKLTLTVQWKDANNIEINAGGQRPLLTLHFQTPPRNSGNQLGLLKDVVLPEQSSSPSGTYAIRVCILAIIAPTGIFAMGIFAMLGPIVATIYNLVVFFAKVLGVYCAFVAFVWVIRGRRPIPEDDFVSRFPGMEVFGGQGAGRRTSRGRRTVWGSSGPIESEEDNVMRPQRRPIRNVADFFRSGAPLDDLLASFDSTRHWTEPMGRNHRSRSQGSAFATPKSLAGGSERHRRVYPEDELDESGLIDLEKALPEKPKVVLKL